MTHRSRATCIDCGKAITPEQKPPSPYWCAECETQRRAHITSSFGAIEAGFEREGKV